VALGEAWAMRHRRSCRQLLERDAGDPDAGPAEPAVRLRGSQGLAIASLP
jgi:hypothetical protein